jgi:hypothetical protein
VGQGIIRVKVALVTPQTPQYLHYRAWLKDHQVVATCKGDEISHLSHKCPMAFTLQLPQEHETIEVQCSAGTVVMAWQGTSGLAMADWLAGDPVWGPDWDHTRIVRVEGTM